MREENVLMIYEYDDVISLIPLIKEGKPVGFDKLHDICKKHGASYYNINDDLMSSDYSDVLFYSWGNVVASISFITDIDEINKAYEVL